MVPEVRMTCARTGKAQLGVCEGGCAQRAEHATCIQHARLYCWIAGFQADDCTLGCEFGRTCVVNGFRYTDTPDLVFAFGALLSPLVL